MFDNVDFTRVLLLVLHVAVAATAFAVTLPVGGALRRAAGAAREAKIAVAEYAARANKLAGIFGILTLITGFVMIFYSGGMKIFKPTLHMAPTLVVVMIVLGFTVAAPAVKRLQAAAESNDLDGWNAARKRLSMCDGIMQLLWVITLATMFMLR